ncbi:hypothetical protein FVP45_13455, partial [Mycobacterium tuberculosis]|nr:hypothetical protein [Mycobacterium tuberculosis]
FGYAATAATATEALLPFEDAPLITNPGGLLEQAVAVEEAIDTPELVIDTWLLSIDTMLLSGDRCGEMAFQSSLSWSNGQM